MTLSVATIRISKRTILPIRIFINRKRLLGNKSSDPNNNDEKTSFQAPLLSNNSIICLRSPITRIYLSNQDMERLCLEIKDTIILILYELTSPKLLKNVLNKLRIGSSMDFQKDVIPNIIDASSSDGNKFLNVPVVTITRISKTKYKLHFKQNWELDIFIKSFKLLTKIRHYLLFTDETIGVAQSLGLVPKRKILLMEQKSSKIATDDTESNEDNTTPYILQENEENGGQEEEESKPIITFKYNPIITLNECISVHVLQRPRRHKT
ncbi:DNA-binding protein SAW1 NDAI_0H02570 [Naumovozyma dairenensis CBS 421]|uniref:Uncharacterized protein n=1 Tax=Naumovozyma dairenensis (strain ATCC 10597 / BCRC 20456 / CBS 421 / NBRC 0211 / NRRL Y-12639) TaxID=1071378 RepID=G0WF70_NAUDC|nr:hypothetical protein NDAI_0H02570 [Naumovozyma dairenensis CBS 421]CCD26431.1 hypothetical protein NDAI_0H02570 [Naumovozyma dairenensis CBS 421]